MPGQINILYKVVEANNDYTHLSRMLLAEISGNIFCVKLQITRKQQRIVYMLMKFDTLV